MKTPRHEQPWYEHRLEHNTKPGPLSAEERTIMTDANRRIIEQAPRLVAYGIKHGLLSYPIKKRVWHPEDIKIDPIHESPLL